MTLVPVTQSWKGVFDVVAHGYDFLTHQELWRDQVLRALELVELPPTGAKVLDIGCGPGMSTFALAERLGPSAEVLGIDIADQMVSLARQHHAREFAHLGNVRFALADAQKMPLDSGRFDLVVGHSVLYMVPDRQRVLNEVLRVLSPGGSMVLLEPHASGSLVVAALKALPQGGELVRRPWAASRFAISMVTWRMFSRMAGRLSPELVEPLMQNAGFAKIDFKPTLAGLGLHCVGRVPVEGSL